MFTAKRLLGYVYFTPTSSRTQNESVPISHSSNPDPDTRIEITVYIELRSSISGVLPSPNETTITLIRSASMSVLIVIY